MLSSSAPTLDVITIGRASVDLYGQQIGGRLEDMASFAKSVGGCPANIAIGVARLGLKSALITRTGDEAMGRFIREQLLREGVDIRGIRVDAGRLTALAMLGVRDEKTFPLIFFRENCADQALEEADIDPAFISTSSAVVVTGTHFARENTAAAQFKAIDVARRHGGRIVFDIDYRPNLWGLAGHGSGEERYIRSQSVTAHLAPVLPLCHLIVGTEEELRIAGGADDTLAALRAIRSASTATIVCKRGPMGCSVFEGNIPASLDDGVRGPGFPVEVYNVLGAGDAFMAGFLRGWLKDEPLELCCTWANACGAFAVSRLLCSPEYPTMVELQHFIAVGSKEFALRNDKELNHIHWATTRKAEPRELCALAIDHRAQLEALADRVKAPRARIAAFKRLAVTAAAKVAAGRPGFGMLLDEKYGRDALFEALGQGLWIGRPVEEPGSRPLQFEGGGDIGARLVEWPLAHTVKCLCFYRIDDDPVLRELQDAKLLELYDATRRIGREFLLEIIASRHGPVDDRSIADVLEHLYGLGIRPDWWKLESQPSPIGWRNIGEVIARHDPFCRGIVMLGLEAPQDILVRAFEAAASIPMVKGFAIGRTIFNKCAEEWLAGRMTDEKAISVMAESFGALTAAWQKARKKAMAGN